MILEVKYNTYLNTFEMSVIMYIINETIEESKIPIKLYFVIHIDTN